ncbi:MAG: GNAT family N-acetyltransferase, partial [Phycisphaerae bacterium]
HAFGHRAFYLAAVRDDTCVGILPLVRVNSILAGTLLVSLPYAIYGGVLADDDATADALLVEARSIARQIGARNIDLRSQRAAFPDLPHIDRYVTFKRNLPETADAALAWLPRKARAAARNARDKFNLTVRFDDDQLPTVYRLYAAGMRRLASLNYPYRFFEQLIARSPGQHLVSVVYHQDRPVAGLLSFIHRDTVLPYFVGATPDANTYSAFNFIYLTLAQRAVELGLTQFDFGRSRLDNAGCCRFKQLQGFTSTPLQYQCDPQPGNQLPDLTPSNPKFRLARKIWPLMPQSVTTRLGAWLSKHIPG